MNIRTKGECLHSKIENRTKASVYFNRAFYDKLRTIAFMRKTSVSEIIRAVVERYVSEQEAEQTEAV